MALALLLHPVPQLRLDLRIAGFLRVDVLPCPRDEPASVDACNLWIGCDPELGVSAQVGGMTEDTFLALSSTTR